MGIAYQPLKFDPSPTEHYAVIKDSFGYVDATGNEVTFTMPGTEFAGYDDLPSKVDLHIVTGNVYLNLITKGKVQPCIGGGYGIAFGTRENSTKRFVHPLLAELQGFAFEGPTTYSSDATMRVITAKFGINVYFKNFVIGGAGGYQNGPLGQFRIGVAF